MSGLRERTIIATKAHIQEAALRLFVAQGYAQTTVEQIADAAEVSQSTFFRYFKTKEAVVLYDGIDPIIIHAFLKQPIDISPIQAMRNATKELGRTLSIERQHLEMQRFALLNTLPALRSRALGDMITSIDHFAITIGQRTGKNPDDIAVRNMAGAIVGVVATVLLQTYKNPSIAIFEGEMDAALARLEKGLNL